MCAGRGLQLEIGGATQMLSLEVIPVGEAEGPASCFIMVFEATPAATAKITFEECGRRSKIAHRSTGERADRQQRTIYSR